MIDTDYIEFNEIKHEYTNIHGVIIPSVTQYLKDYIKPFDSDYWAQKKADEEGITKEQMLQKWVDKRELGSLTHGSLKNFIIRNGKSELHESISDWIKEKLLILINDDDLILYPEQIVYSETMNLAGTIDLVVKRKSTREMYVIDFKTDKNLTTFFRTKNEQGELINCPKMKEPYDTFNDTNLNHYIVQVMKYSEILVANGYLCDYKKAEIWHLTKSKIYSNLFEPYRPKRTIEDFGISA